METNEENTEGKRGPGAPKGHKYALKHGYGRPPFYATVDDLMEAVVTYLVSETTKSGVCRSTMSGMSRALGFRSKEALAEQAQRDKHNAGRDTNGAEWAYAVDQIKLILEENYEKNLHEFKWAGAAFALKNLFPQYWKDETTQNQIQTLTKVEPRVIKPEGTPELGTNDTE